MVSGQTKSNAKISHLWDIGSGVTQRVVDIINQCRYLASKRGMNVKELRLSMREDEAKQRQLSRYTDICSQQLKFLSPSGINDILHCGTAACPPWLLNNHGMIYSQYNVQNYGQLGSKTVVTDPWSYLSSNKSKRQAHSSQRSWEYYHDSSKKQILAREGKDDMAFSSEDSILSKGTTSQSSNSATASLDNRKGSDEKVMNLLYSASKNNRLESSMKNNFDKKQLDASSSELIDIDFIKSPVIPKRGNCINGISLDMTTSTLTCNLPARKLASHNLASLCAAEGDLEDESKMIGNGSSNSSLDFNRNGNSDSELDFSEIQVVEEIDHDKTVVSPLIQRVESAFADLHKNDSLFGTMDEFGDLMSEANRIL